MTQAMKKSDSVASVASVASATDMNEVDESNELTAFLICQKYKVHLHKRVIVHLADQVAYDFLQKWGKMPKRKLFHNGDGFPYFCEVYHQTHTLFVLDVARELIDTLKDLGHI